MVVCSWKVVGNESAPSGREDASQLDMLNRRLQKISRRLVATCSCTKNSVGDLQSGTPTRPVAVYFQITQDLRQTLRQQVGTQCWSGDVATTVGAGRLPITDALKTVQDCRCFAHDSGVLDITTRNFNEILYTRRGVGRHASPRGEVSLLGVNNSATNRRAVLTATCHNLCRRVGD